MIDTIISTETYEEFITASQLIKHIPSTTPGVALSEEHFTPRAEYLISLPKDTLCACGCTKECHRKIRGVSGLSGCASRKHQCQRFTPL